MNFWKQFNASVKVSGKHYSMEKIRVGCWNKNWIAWMLKMNKCKAGTLNEEVLSIDSKNLAKCVNYKTSSVTKIWVLHFPAKILISILAQLLNGGAKSMDQKMFTYIISKQHMSMVGWQRTNHLAIQCNISTIVLTEPGRSRLYSSYRSRCNFNSGSADLGRYLNCLLPSQDGCQFCTACSWSTKRVLSGPIRNVLIFLKLFAFRTSQMRLTVQWRICASNCSDTGG